MIDKEETAIFKMKQDFNKNKEKNFTIYQICRKLASCINHMFLCSNGM